MAYEHGVRISEQATSLLPTVEVSAAEKKRKRFC